MINLDRYRKTYNSYLNSISCEKGRDLILVHIYFMKFVKENSAISLKESDLKYSKDLYNKLFDCHKEGRVNTLLLTVVDAFCKRIAEKTLKQV